MLVGTKSEGRVLPESRRVMEEYAEGKNLKYIETSALRGDNVKKAFVQLACEIDETGMTRSFTTNNRLRISRADPEDQRSVNNY